MKGEINNSPMLLLVSKLKIPKSIVINWEKGQKKPLKEKLCYIEREFETLYSHNVSGVISYQETYMIHDLEQNKLSILRKEREAWRQKSRVNWLAKEDANTKYFHQFFYFMRIVNTVWEVKSDFGEIIVG